MCTKTRSTRCGKYNHPNTRGPKALFNQPDRKSKQSTSRKPRHQITRDTTYKEKLGEY